jgi:hypothetical protein
MNRKHEGRLHNNKKGREREKEKEKEIEKRLFQIKTKIFTYRVFRKD